MTEPDDLAGLAATVRDGAATRGIATFDGLPLLRKSVSVAYWSGDCDSFLDLGKLVGAGVVYVGVTTFARQDRLAEAMADSGFRDPYGDDDDEDDDGDGDAEPPDDSAQWLLDRLLERTDEWAVQEGSTCDVACLWFKDGVAHLFRREAGWLSEFDDAARGVLDEARQTRTADRRAHSDGEAKRLHRLADEMVRHPRYSEATSEAKREYMAEQLCPDEDAFEWRRIAARAALLYWWDVEPIELVSKAQRVRALYDAGETMTGVAAILNVSREKVRRMLAETETSA